MGSGAGLHAYWLNIVPGAQVEGMPDSSVRPLSAQRANEARLLALMLRTSRLTWLFAADGTDKSALLVRGLLPLLRRRQ